MRGLSNTLFRAHRAAADEMRSQYIVKTGRAFQKSKKLHNIEGLSLDGASIQRNKECWISPLCKYYSEKWGSCNIQLRSSALDFIASTENSTWKVEWQLIERALDTIRTASNRDASGICVLIVRLFAYGHSEAAESLFSSLFNSRTFMQSFTVQGKVFGKESKFPAVDKTRALLPLPALLIVADAIVACKLHDLVDRICVPPPGVMFGARKGTQVLDVAHAAQLHLQKGGDNFGEAGLAQGDIASYYDSINSMRIARWIAGKLAVDGVFWASCF